MFISNLRRRLNDISISRKLYFTIGFTALLVTIEICVLWVSPKTDLVLKVFLAVSITTAISSILIILSVNYGLKRALNTITAGAERIKRGELRSRVEVYSKDEIGILATAFNDMADTLDNNIRELKLTEKHLIKEKERVEQSEKAKQHFLINMSHEIRTPMNAILGFARHLEESLNDKDQQESIKMIIKSGDHLLMTFNDILDFSRIGTGEINFMALPFNLNETIQSIFMLTEPNARFKKVGLTYSIDENIPKMLYGDSVKLTQILLNLTSNAIKFTERGGIVISAAKTEEDSNQVVVEFRIKDTGIGIPSDKIDKIFDVFEQGTNSMSRKFGGTGVGLSIVKQLVTLQGGKISVESVLGRGSEFCFSLPFSTQNLPDDEKGIEGNSRQNADDRKDGKGIKVLIVEDNAINQLLVLKLLHKHGYDTTVAENGKIALHKFNKADFDIILMDLQMPEMDGYEATIQIRKMDSYKRFVPIVAMTAYTIKGEYEKCMSTGMNDYISKPFRAAELYEKIQFLVRTEQQI
ncbi:ATP-binding protein [Pedobacter frigoris]|uniref:histidine kinase n=1 Tax=Pedobacter frigoris TaxID=2571272 RepID=A0A4V5P1L0_9SPHI|nr:ATP-binding protein [Pedobacter frigoris]TKC07028.1 response regulator [Pedobacter frigoris]